MATLTVVVTMVEPSAATKTAVLAAVVSIITAIVLPSILDLTSVTTTVIFIIVGVSVSRTTSTLAPIAIER